MLVKMSEDFAEKAQLSLSSIMVVLKEVFAKYEQPGTLEDLQKVSGGPVMMPIVQFEPHRIHLKNNSIKNTHCEARFVVYSKRPDETIPAEKEGDAPTIKKAPPCARFIHAERCISSREEMFKKVPGPVLNASFDHDGECTLEQLLVTLGAIPADKVSFFYTPCTCEGVITHSLAVVHEFLKEDEVEAVFTTYFSINVSK